MPGQWVDGNDVEAVRDCAWPTRWFGLALAAAPRWSAITYRTTDFSDPTAAAIATWADLSSFPDPLIFARRG